MQKDTRLVQTFSGGRMNSKDIGKRIVALREERKLSQKELAEMIPVAPATLSRWENGLVTPPLPQLDRICEIMNISLEDVFSGDRAEYVQLHIKYTRLRLVFTFSVILLFLGILIFMLPKYEVVSSQENYNDNYGENITFYVRPIFYASERGAFSYGSKLAAKYADKGIYNTLEVVFVRSGQNLTEEDNEIFTNVYFLSNYVDY